jgi:hypothetical protein
VHDADADYARLLDGGEAHPWRAALELTLLLGGGTLWYWIDNRNVLDWDDPSIEQRLDGRAWTFDNNAFPMNFVFHPLSGAAFYALPRANNLGVATSAAYGFAASMMWEYVIEFKEKVSINDVLVTPGAGLTFGEFFHKLAWYLNRTPGPATTGQTAVQWIFGPTVAIHRTLDGVSSARGGSSDALGFSDDIWHRFATWSGFGTAGTPSSDTAAPAGAVNFEGELVSMPGYLRPGSIARFFHEADFTHLAVEVSASDSGTGLEAISDTVLLGYLSQQLSTATRGNAAVIGTSIGYRYLRSTTRGMNERLGVLHFPGAALDWHLFAGTIAARLSARAHADFAGIGSLAYKRWRVAHPDERKKSILLRHGYYYGWGASARLGAELSAGPLRFSGDVMIGGYDSQEGRDRRQSVVTADIDLTDTLLEYQTSLELDTLLSPLTVGGVWSRRNWNSRAGDATASAVTESLMATLNYEF